MNQRIFVNWVLDIYIMPEIKKQIHLIVSVFLRKNIAMWVYIFTTMYLPADIKVIMDYVKFKTFICTCEQY